MDKPNLNFNDEEEDSETESVELEIENENDDDDVEEINDSLEDQTDEFEEDTLIGEDENEKEDEDEKEGEKEDEDEDENEKEEGNIEIKNNINDDDVSIDLNESDYESDEEEIYLFDDDLENTIINDVHTLLKVNNFNEIKTKTILTRDIKNNIIDELHKTIPILTKYEKAKILGIRAHQINSGCKVFIETTHDEIDSYLLAERELYEKKIPFIIKRPLPSGENEYWNISDLELII